MGSGASELLGWGSYLTEPGEEEAQRLPWDLNGRLMDPVDKAGLKWAWS